MDSFELNKILGALAGMFGIYLAISIVTDAMYHPGHHGEEHHLAYALEIEGDDHGGGGEPVEEVSLAALMAEADPGAGERVFKKCQSCHNIEPGGAAKTGPNLWGIVGRAVASEGGFGYSDSLKEVGGEWDWETLSAFIHNPKDVASGTIMSFAGIKKDDQRADLLAYLNQQSDGPLPLPTE